MDEKLRELADRVYDVAREIPPGKERSALYGIALDLYRLEVATRRRQEGQE